MAPVEVSISGHSTLHRYPERGILNVVVHSSGLSQKEVSDDVRSATERVAKQFESLYDVENAEDAPITYYTIHELSTQAWTEYARDKEEQIVRDKEGKPAKEWTEYGATVHSEAFFRDFVKLSETATALAVTKYVTIKNTKWIILEETEKSLLAESVREAYAHALVKARAYADQMDLRIVRPVKVMDEGESASTESNTGHSRTKQTARRSMRPILDTGNQMLTFAPRDVTLRGSCSVDFEIF